MEGWCRQKISPGLTDFECPAEIRLQIGRGYWPCQIFGTGRLCRFLSADALEMGLTVGVSGVESLIAFSGALAARPKKWF